MARLLGSISEVQMIILCTSITKWRPRSREAGGSIRGPVLVHAEPQREARATESLFGKVIGPYFRWVPRRAGRTQLHRCWPAPLTRCSQPDHSRRVQQAS